MASPDLKWLLLKDYSSFIVKSNGITFNKEPMNLTQKNSFKYSGFGPAKALGLDDAKRGVVLVTKKRSFPSKPGSGTVRHPLKNDVRRSARSIKNLTKGYRPDLQKAALGRLCAVARAKKEAAPKIKKRAPRGRKRTSA
eukprot:NODE_2398_length_579_cov_130.004425_g2348_i0.p1 GENE.NODE_2398_length_579_cov_130.004425_g2348_i0~~NODE_2398_length_579_cov_130.004425_g2348_i0.p1  ORF type:complete len:139 (-),score=30.47 NODE_2398_length_579_cov_130.004425_g2348_i0:36-452(-)